MQEAVINGGHGIGDGEGIKPDQSLLDQARQRRGMKRFDPWIFKGAVFLA
jgi:hypothetical protein